MPYRANGFCVGHDGRNKKYGDPLAGPPLRSGKGTFSDAWVMPMVTILPNGCWRWGGATRGDYGVCEYNGEQVGAHVAFYRHHVGPIAEGFVVDHECHNRDTDCPGGHLCHHRRCVNPTHLAAKSNQDNLLASPLTLAAQNAAKTQCDEGHDFTDANTYINPAGSRVCRKCANKRQREYQARRRAAA